MKKKKIICFLEIIFILLFMHAYSNYSFKQSAIGSEIELKPDQVYAQSIDIPLPDKVRILSIKLMSQSGQRPVDPSGVMRNPKGDGFNKLPDKGYVIIKIIDDEENIVKSYTLKSGDILSRVTILNEGKYHFQYESKDGFQGYVEGDIDAWKLI